MIARLKTACVAGFALAGLGLVGSVQAMPAGGLQHALATSADVAQVENVRLVCPPYRPCFRVPGYGYGYGYRRRSFYRPYGYGYRPYRPYGPRHFY